MPDNRDDCKHRGPRVGELYIADCSCGWSCDLIVYHDDAGKFMGWCYAEGDGDLHEPAHMQVFAGVGKTRRAACIHVQCPKCGNEFSILIEEREGEPT